MQEMEATAWKHQGSSVIFDKDELLNLTRAGCLVSLREALSWKDNWPNDPPRDVPTVLIGGLDTFLDVLEPEQAEEFLHSEIKPFIMEFQDQWENVGLVFGFNRSINEFPQDAFGNVLLDHQKRRIALSKNLWNGNALRDIRVLIFRDGNGVRTHSGGFYVIRLS